jgi:hypothetical protein
VACLCGIVAENPSNEFSICEKSRGFSLLLPKPLSHKNEGGGRGSSFFLAFCIGILSLHIWGTAANVPFLKEQ